MSAASPDGTATPAVPAEPQKIELTQEKLDEIANKAYARGAKNSEGAKEVVALRTEVEELRGLKAWLEAEAAKAADPATPAADPTAEAQFKQKLEAIQAEYNTRVKALEEKQSQTLAGLQGDNDALRVSGLKSDVVTDIAGIAADPNEVFTLMNAEGRFQLDEELQRYVVIDPTTKKVQLDVDADGEPLTPGKAAVGWLDKNPRHKRSSGRTGSGQGTGEGPGGEEPSSELDASNMKPSEIYRRRHELVDSIRGS